MGKCVCVWLCTNFDAHKLHMLGDIYCCDVTLDASLKLIVVKGWGFPEKKHFNILTNLYILTCIVIIIDFCSDYNPIMVQHNQIKHNSYKCNNFR